MSSYFPGIGNTIPGRLIGSGGSGSGGGTPPPEPITPDFPTIGRLLFLDTPSADAWTDSTSGVTAEALDPAFMPALTDGVFVFDGVNDKLKMNDTRANTLSFGHMFVVFKTNNRSTPQMIIGKKNPSGNTAGDYEFLITINPVLAPAIQNNISVWIADNASTLGTQMNSAVTIENDQYYLAEIELRFTSTNGLIYRQNGVQTASATKNPIPLIGKSAANRFYIGQMPVTSETSNNYAMNGSIAHVSIFSRTLTPEERNQVYDYAETWVPSITRA